MYPDSHFPLEVRTQVVWDATRSYKKSASTGGDSDEYRFRLTREWGDGGRAVFIALNPSTADHFDDDQTIRKMCGFAGRWGCTGVVVFNIYPLRTRDPKKLLSALPLPTPAVDTNIRVIDEHFRHEEGHPRDRIVACWGGNARQAEAETVLRYFAANSSMRLEALGVNRDGSPTHPLYVPYATPLRDYPDTKL